MTKNNEDIENNFNRIITFFESYDNKKIDKYESQQNELNLMKSTIENYIKKHANVKIVLMIVFVCLLFIKFGSNTNIYLCFLFG